MTELLLVSVWSRSLPSTDAFSSLPPARSAAAFSVPEFPVDIVLEKSGGSGVPLCSRSFSPELGLILFEEMTVGSES